MLFLIETMVNEKNALSILPTLGLDHFEYVLPFNDPGGLAVLWNNSVIRASVFFTEPCAIHMLVHDTTNKKTTIVSEVYAPTQLQHKEQFREHLAELSGVINPP